LAKPNYEFAKRQRDLAKKQKKEEKKKRKQEASDAAAATAPTLPDDEQTGVPAAPAGTGDAS